MAELADALDSGSSESNFMQVRPLLSAPHKNESYDIIGIATFVLFLFIKTLVLQGFSAFGHKR